MSMGGTNGRISTHLGGAMVRQITGIFGTSSQGFTIIETLIVLSVSSILAVGAILLISGRQNITQFQVSINDLQQQFQQIINQTASGYYPNNQNFQCHGNSSPTIGGPLLAHSSSQQQGTNLGCIFVGNALQFNSSNAGTSSPNDKFTVYPLVGDQYTDSTDSTESTDLLTAKPTAIAQGMNTNKCTFFSCIPNDYSEQSTENGLTFDSASYSPAIAQPPNVTVIAFVTSFGQYDPQNPSLLQSGSQHLSLYAVADPSNGTPISMPRKSIVDTINSSSSNFVPIDSVQICYNSGSTTQSGQFTIGGSGSLQVSLKIFSNPSCA